MREKHTPSSIRQFIQDENLPIEMLDKEYLNVKTDMNWGCKICKKPFVRKLPAILKKICCPTCADTEKIREIDRTLKEKGLERVSEYTGCKDKLVIKCAKGHQVDTTWNALITNGFKCRDCRGKTPLSENKVALELKSKNIIGLTEFKNSNSPMTFECLIPTCRYIWQTRYGAIQQGRGCSGCCGNLKKDSKRIESVLKSRKIKLNSKCENSNTLLELECENCGNLWEDRFSHIDLLGKGCPTCSKTEPDMCRKILEDNFSLSFPKSKPSFLKGLELTGFSEQGQIAFDYIILRSYGENPIDYEKWRDDCAKKVVWCKENGVPLFTIASIEVRDNAENLVDFIQTKCTEFIAANSGVEEKRDRRLYSIAIIKKYFKDNNIPIVCLSKVFTSVSAPMVWCCEKCLNKWSVPFGEILYKGVGCGKCAVKNRTISLEEIDTILESKNIKRLSESYTPAEKMDFECGKCGWLWKTTFSSVKNISGCARCSGNLQIQEEQVDELLEEKKLKRLDPYEEYEKPMFVACLECKWEWPTTYACLRRSGCPNCAGIRPLTVEEVDEHLASKNMERIGDYKNANSSLSVKCLNEGCGRIFNPSFSSIKGNNTGCPYCSRFKNENGCRTLLEGITGLTLQKCKPAFLERLELDGYDSKAGIAFEYHGEQHYRYIPFFHKNDPSRFEAQKERDKRKLQLCFENGIDLFVVDCREFESERNQSEYLSRKYLEFIEERIGEN